MNIFREIYEQIRDMTQDYVPQIQWIDINEGQIDISDRQMGDYEHPPISFPAMLVDVSELNGKPNSTSKDKLNVKLVITLAFQKRSETWGRAPGEVANQALAHTKIGDHVLSLIRNAYNYSTFRVERLQRSDYRVYQITANLHFIE